MGGAECIGLSSEISTIDDNSFVAGSGTRGYNGIVARRQQEIVFRTWGGRRKGAGRKPSVPGKPGAKHRRRPDFDGRHPLHVTLRVTRELPNLRRRHVWQALVWALAVTARRDDMRVV